MRRALLVFVCLAFVPAVCGASPIGFSTGTFSYAARCKDCSSPGTDFFSWAGGSSSLSVIAGDDFDLAIGPPTQPLTIAGLHWIDNGGHNVLPLDLTWDLNFVSGEGPGVPYAQILLDVNANNGKGADDKIVLPDLSGVSFSAPGFIVSGLRWQGTEAAFDALTRTWTLQGGESKIYLAGSYANAPATDASPVPEPASMVLVGTGLLGVAALARRRRRTGNREAGDLAMNAD